MMDEHYIIAGWFFLCAAGMHLPSIIQRARKNKIRRTK